uniref:DUF1725 domain-containing protein n=1 Tax=Sus scrofa TaxID=9823 RepID=A0A8D1PWU3_PIG
MTLQSHSWAYIWTKFYLKETHAPACSWQHYSLFQDIWKQPKCPSADDWIRKMWYTCTMEYYSAIKKNDIMLFAATWMELETLILSEMSQKDKGKYHMISLITGI